MFNEARVFVAGHRGMVGSAIVRCLAAKGHKNIVTRTHAELDLTQQQAVREFFASEKIDQVYLAAAKVGGIHANNAYPAEFIYQNLQSNSIEQNGVFTAAPQDAFEVESSDGTPMPTCYVVWPTT